MNPKPSGEPSERVYFDAIRSAFTWLTVSKGFAHNRIILFVLFVCIVAEGFHLFDSLRVCRFGAGIGTGPIVEVASELYGGRPKSSHKKGMAALIVL